MVTQNYNLNLVPGEPPKYAYVSKYDDKSRDIVFSLFSGSKKFTIPESASVTVDGTKKNGEGFSHDCTFSDNKVTVKPSVDMTNIDGDVPCQLTIIDGDETLGTANFILKVERGVLDELSPEQATDAYDILKKAREATAEALEVADHPNITKNGTWWKWDHDANTYVDTHERSVLRIDKTYPSLAAMEADKGNQPENTIAIIQSNVEDENNAKLYIHNGSGWTYLADLSGFTGVGIESIELTNGNHAPGTTDTYTITLDNKQKHTFTVWNGATGPEGKKGDKGDEGKAATITIGTVTTGEPGSSASVKNVGTENEARFDFVIPEGKKGDVGPVGPAGGVDSVNGVQGDVILGGRNLLLETRTWAKPWKISGWTVEEEKYNGLTVISKSTAHGDPDQRRVNAKAGEVYTFSFYAKTTAAGVLNDRWFNIMNSVHDGENPSWDTSFIQPPYQAVHLTAEFTRYSGSFKILKDCTLYTRIDIGTDGDPVYLCGIKLEKGNVATDWSPAPEDLENKVTSVNGMTGDVIIGSQHRYTVQWDQTNNTMTRLNDAAAITTDTKNFGYFGSVNSNYDNPFDHIYPWSGRRLCNIDIEVYSKLATTQSLSDCVVAWEGDPDFSYSHKYGVWVYTPEFWGRTWTSGSNRFFEVTDIKSTGYIRYPESIKGRWHGVKVNLEVSGSAKDVLLPLVGMPAACYAISQMHTQAKNYNATLDSIYTIDADTLLFLVEYANTNAQTVLGQGVSGMYHTGNVHPVTVDGNVVTVLASDAGAVEVGSIIGFQTASGDECDLGRYEVTKVEAVDTNKKLTLKGTLNTSITIASFWGLFGKANTKDEQIGSKSGYIGTNGRSIAYYRGVEMYANMFFYVLGAYRQTNTNHIWIAKDVYDADDADGLDINKHIDTGIKLATSADNAISSGYIQTLATYKGLAAVPFCTATGGTSDKPVGDYIWMTATSTGNTILLFGGIATAGLNCGPFATYWHHNSLRAWWHNCARPVLKIPR